MAFMQPDIQYFTEQEAKEYCPDLMTDEPGEDVYEVGWYGRLSAPGYLDCTEWFGPFKTAQDTLDYIMETFEVDENGDDVEEEE